MARRKSRRASRRVKDKWKSKKWYRIVAPDMFDGSVVGETVASEPESLLGRVSEISLQDLTGDFSRVHIKVQLKIDGIRGGECITRFIGHDMTTDYVRRLTRRRRSKIDANFDVKTKEGYKIRIKPLSVTDKRINSSIKRSIRNKQKEVIKELANNSTLPELVSKMIFGDLAKEVAQSCKEIYPLKKVEIRKSEILSRPKDEELEVRIITEEELEEESEEEEEAAEEEEEEDEVKTKPEVIDEFQDIEGVGPTMAEKLYDGGFKSFVELRKATKEELQKVEGIGKTVSERIYNTLHGE